MEKIDKTNRERSKNFKDAEIQLLLQLVDTHKHVVECKKTDQISSKDKDATWEVIAEDFNNVSGIYHRDAKTLRAKYENLKKITKRKFAQERRNVMGTGGGPSIKTDIGDIELKIKDIIVELPILGQQSRYDSDATANLATPSPRPKPDLEISNDKFNSPWDITECPVFFEEEVGLVPLEKEDRPEEILKPAVKRQIFTGFIVPNCEISDPTLDIPNKTSCGEFNVVESPKKKKIEESGPLKLTTPVSKPQKFNLRDLQTKKISSPLTTTRKKKSVLDNSVAGKKIEIVSEAKKELLDIQKELHSVQIQIMKTEHDAKLKCMREELDAKLECMREELDAKLECMRQEREKNQQLMDLKIQREKLEIELLNNRL